MINNARAVSGARVVGRCCRPIVVVVVVAAAAVDVSAFAAKSPSEPTVRGGAGGECSSSARCCNSKCLPAGRHRGCTRWPCILCWSASAGHVPLHVRELLPRLRVWVLLSRRAAAHSVRAEHGGHCPPHEEQREATAEKTATMASAMVVGAGGADVATCLLLSGPVRGPLSLFLLLLLLDAGGSKNVSLRREAGCR